jgi:hypothetical protein
VRLISRNDASLVVGLIAGTVVIFQRPLRVVWETALDVQQQYHVDLLPALTIFAGVFIFHEARKRQQAKADARAAAVEGAQARMRSAELERLMTFSQALANALDPPTLQQAAGRRCRVSGQAGGEGSLQRRRRSRGVGHSVGASSGRPAGGRRPPAMSAW